VVRFIRSLLILVIGVIYYLIKSGKIIVIYFFNFIETKGIYYLPVTKPFHESVNVIDVCNDVLICYKSSLNKPGQLFIVKVQSVDRVYDFTDISIHAISPSRSLPNSDKFVVEHGYTLYSKI